MKKVILFLLLLGSLSPAFADGITVVVRTPVVLSPGKTAEIVNEYTIGNSVDINVLCDYHKSITTIINTEEKGKGLVIYKAYCEVK